MRLMEEEPMVHSTHSSGPTTFDHVMMVCYACWSLALVGLAVLCIAFIAMAPGVAQNQGYNPAGWQPSLLASSFASWYFFVAVANVIASALLWRRRRWTWLLGVVAVTAGLTIAMAPAVTRALLPWEDPATGEGSPLAVLMSIVFLAVAFGVVIGLPGVAGFIWLIAGRQRLVRADDTD